jgi:hypothetical protein
LPHERNCIPAWQGDGDGDSSLTGPGSLFVFIVAFAAQQSAEPVYQLFGLFQSVFKLLWDFIAQLLVQLFPQPLINFLEKFFFARPIQSCWF